MLRQAATNPWDAPTLGDAPRQTRQNLFELAYEAIEDRLVDGSLAPGRYLTMNDLMQVTGYGRTPVHHAVNRLAADTLMLIRPRHGLQVAPIDLARERTLLWLRRDLERFVVRLAAKRAGAACREQILRVDGILKQRRSHLDLDEFNRLDRTIDRLVLAAAGEPFLESTLRPLHTLFRRIGHIHHTHAGRAADISATIDRHIAVLDAIAAQDAQAAVHASDALIDFVDGMFDEMAAKVDPALLDCNAAPGRAG
jgi:DNA-binding GntR family transcriptional regulator